MTTTETTVTPERKVARLAEQRSVGQGANKATLVMAGVTVAGVVFCAGAGEQFVSFADLSKLATQGGPVLIVAV